MIIKCVDCKEKCRGLYANSIPPIPITCEIAKDYDTWIDTESGEVSTLYGRYVLDRLKNRETTE
jgi:hypothetical protein